jgi:hypothetical protein
MSRKVMFYHWVIVATASAGLLILIFASDLSAVLVTGVSHWTAAVLVGLLLFELVNAIYTCCSVRATRCRDQIQLTLLLVFGVCIFTLQRYKDILLGLWLLGVGARSSRQLSGFQQQRRQSNHELIQVESSTL